MAKPKIPWMITAGKLEVKVSSEASKRLAELVQHMEWPEHFAMRKIVNQFIWRINSDLEALKNQTLSIPVYEQKVELMRKIEAEYIDWLQKLARITGVPVDSLISHAIFNFDLKRVLEDFQVDCAALDPILAARLEGQEAKNREA